MAEIKENLRFDEMIDGRKFVPKKEIEAEANEIEFDNQKRQKHNQIEYEKRDAQRIEQVKRISDEIRQHQEEQEEEKEDDNKKDNEELTANAEMLAALKAMAAEQESPEIYNALAVTCEKLSRHDEALEYFRKAVELGSASAQRNLAIAFEQMEDITPREYKEVFDLYKQAADKNDMFALNNLGCLYIEGNGVEVNFKAAFDCFEKAADLGDTFAKVNYGDMLMYGIVTDVNKEKAFNLYKEAAEKNNITAIIKTADCYLIGNGTKLNTAMALEFYKKAEQLGDKAAGEKVKSIENKIKPQRHEKLSADVQIAEANKMAAEYRAAQQAEQNKDVKTKTNEVSL